jgi:Tol biopolymer transport system component
MMNGIFRAMALSLAGFITACSFSGPVSPVTPGKSILLDQPEILKLDNEYSAFSVKSLAASYLLRKLRRFSSDGNDTALVKELKYAMFKGDDSLPFSAALDADFSLCGPITASQSVKNARETEPAFDSFIESKCPAPVSLGKIVFSRGTTKFSRTFDIYTMDAIDANFDGTGDNLTQLTNNFPIADSDPQWSPDKSRIAFRSGNKIYIMDAADTDHNGVGDNLKMLSSNGRLISFSPDGSKILFQVSSDSGVSEIYLMDAADIDNDGSGDNLVRLTTTDTAGFDYQEIDEPSFSPDGSKILFTWFRPGIGFDIFVMDAVDSDNDGYGDNLTNLTENNNMNLINEYFQVWSPDGSKIAFSGNDLTGISHNIYIMAADGSNIIQLFEHPDSSVVPVFSPDSSKITFTADEEIYLMDAADSNNDGTGDNFKRLTNNSFNDINPSFSADGKKIIFTSQRTDEFQHPFHFYAMDTVDNDNDGNGDNLIRFGSGFVGSYQLK